MKFYCLWECTDLGVTFLAEVLYQEWGQVRECPFHPWKGATINEETGETHIDHFKDGHVRPVSWVGMGKESGIL
jgi:hypothetical protein